MCVRVRIWYVHVHISPQVPCKVLTYITEPHSLPVVQDDPWGPKI